LGKSTFYSIKMGIGMYPKYQTSKSSKTTNTMAINNDNEFGLYVVSLEQDAGLSEIYHLKWTANFGVDLVKLYVFIFLKNLIFKY